MLTANWGWFLLIAIITGIAAFALAARSMYKSFTNDAPKALSNMLGGMETSLNQSKATGEDDTAAIVGASFSGFAASAIPFFGNFIKRGILPGVLSIVSTVTFILAVVGLIANLLGH